ncbi:MAG TPA: metal-sensing transcriptional repressor [Treponemataceae bacterium]|nr:metal-sensing transcriptional repressor [Treponemataceae bacterium]
MKADTKKVSLLLKTARGQLDGILKMIEDDRYCIDISNQIQATTSILRKANTEVLTAHMHHCVRQSFLDGNEIDRETKMNELIRILEKSTK